MIISLLINIFLKVVCKIIAYAQKGIEYLLFKSIKRSYHSFA